MSKDSDLCAECVKRRDRLRVLHQGKRPEHTADFTSGQIEEIDRLRAEGQNCECWVRHRDLARNGKSEAPGGRDWMFQKPSAPPADEMPGWEALEYAARTLESAEQSLRQMGAYGNADILHPAAVWLRGLEQRAQEKRNG